MGDLESASQAAEQALANFNLRSFPGGRSRSLILLALIRGKQRRMQSSEQLSAEALDAAYREGDLGTTAEAWDHLGETYLDSGLLHEAERALTEAFRLRSLHRLRRLDHSYLNLGCLRLAQGDWRSALALLDRAVERQTRPDSLNTSWSVYYARGRARAAANRLSDAFEDFHRALTLARTWRLAVLPADFTRIGSEVQLDDIYTAYVHTGGQLYLTTGRVELARETFRASEENRAGSLHALEHHPKLKRAALPPEYWGALAQMHSVEVKLLRDDSEAHGREMRRLRLQVLEMEAQAGSTPQFSTDQLVERTQAALPTDAALFSFELGREESFVWAITRNRFHLYPLPRQSELAADIGAFSDAIRTGGTRGTQVGRGLYEKLVGRVDANIRAKPHWILVLDEQLFQAPLAALVVGESESGPVYLAERHSLEIVSSAVRIAAPKPGRRETLPASGFVGVGDAIYNTADPRWKLPAASSSHTRDSATLARLAGSGHEIDACARAWNAAGRKTTVLQGADAVPERLRGVAGDRPAVIHFATHFVQARQAPRYAMIAMALSPT
jgi:tetratricopeptide (TPR) repeat protein